MLILLPVGLVVVLLVTWTLQRRLVYYPTGDVPLVGDVLPGWSDVTLETEDGLRLAAWYSEPRHDRSVVVVFPGNAGNRADRAMLGSRLATEGLGVLLVDYRGYGGNPGDPTETGLARDARAAAEFVDRRAPGHAIVLFGESLGAAVAIELATAQPPAALILRSPFTSLVDVARAHYPLVPGRLVQDRYPSDQRIGAVRSPVLIIAGENDSIVPISQSERLYDLANEPKAFVTLPDADHNDSEVVAGSAMIEAVVRFIDETTS